MSFIHVNVLYLTVGLTGLNTCILLVTEFELQVSAVPFLPYHFGLEEQWNFFPLKFLQNCGSFIVVHVFNVITASYLLQKTWGFNPSSGQKGISHFIGCLYQDCRSRHLMNSTKFIRHQLLPALLYANILSKMNRCIPTNTAYNQATSMQQWLNQSIWKNFIKGYEGKIQLRRQKRGRGASFIYVVILEETWA